MYDVITKSCITLPDLPFENNCRGVVLSGYFCVMEKKQLKLHRVCLTRRMEWEFLKYFYEWSGQIIVQEHMVTDGNYIFLIENIKSLLLIQKLMILAIT